MHQYKAKTQSITYCLFMVLSFVLLCSKSFAQSKQAQNIRGWSAVQTMAGDAELAFSVDENLVHNHFYRQGPAAAHTVLTSGKQPRLVVAFPAGNSGVSLWFKPSEKIITWQPIEQVKAIQQKNEKGQVLNGIEAMLLATGSQLTIDEAVLSSIRLIRGFHYSRKIPVEITSKIQVENKSITWYRDRLDGQGSYKLKLEVIQGKVSKGKDASLVINATKQGFKFKLSALTGDTPLTPITLPQLLTEPAHDDLNQNILAYLSYQEKLLAGSWRFATYFGRDTLMSLQLLLPALTPHTIEAGLGSVVERLSQHGAVAHEEDVGEFVLYRQLKDSRTLREDDFLDYKMLDDNYMLAPLLARYFLEHENGKQRAQAFLARTNQRGESFRELIQRNFSFVVSSAEAFAKAPSVTNLIAIKDGHHVGEWRDSREGLGNGKYPYNVNAILVPAALNAVSRLQQSELFNVPNNQIPPQSAVARYASVWQMKAPEHFVVTLSKQQASKQIKEYAKELGVPAAPALASLTHESITFNAVSLDKSGRPVPILHSDDGFALLLGKPSSAQIESSVNAIFKPFPAGLMTPIGMLVANPAYAHTRLQKAFTHGHYHGTVVWSWQQALMAAGIAKQISRKDLPTHTLELLEQANTEIWKMIDQSKKVSHAELWSWSHNQKGYQFEAFGQRSGDKTESNAAQLWSTVYLSVAPRPVAHKDSK